MTVLKRACLGTIAALVVACGSSAPGPAALDTSNDLCQFCRMVVSDARFASQIVAPNEEPRFFDDLSCLSRYLTARGPLPPGARVYVADHRTRQWVAAGTAVFTQVGATAPMGSRVIAHASTASRDADEAAAGGQPMLVHDVLPVGLKSGSRP